MPSLEVCCFNSRSALNANQAGATRIELCGDLFPGGSTPDHHSFVQLRSAGKITIPTYVIIRPRGGDFRYTAVEYEIMKNEIQKFKIDTTMKPEGFVFGILDDENRVEMKRNKELVESVKPLHCTFHRAFDEIPPEKMEQALEDVIACGFRNILTSGGKNTAVEGVEMLKTLVQKAGGRINIMPGGAVRSENIGILVKETNAEWFHSSGLADGEKIPAVGEIKELLQGLQGIRQVGPAGAKPR